MTAVFFILLISACDMADRVVPPAGKKAESTVPADWPLSLGRTRWTTEHYQFYGSSSPVTRPCYYFDADFNMTKRIDYIWLNGGYLMQDRHMMGLEFPGPDTCAWVWYYYKSDADFNDAEEAHSTIMFHQFRSEEITHAEIYEGYAHWSENKTPKKVIDFDYDSQGRMTGASCVFIPANKTIWTRDIEYIDEHPTYDRYIKITENYYGIGIPHPAKITYYYFYYNHNDSYDYDQLKKLKIYDDMDGDKIFRVRYTYGHNPTSGRINRYDDDGDFNQKIRHVHLEAQYDPIDPVSPFNMYKDELEFMNEICDDTKVISKE